MMTPKIIICMSTFNGEQFLNKQIQSIRSQDYTNWILLIHDDGSTDNTIKIINNFLELDNRIQLVTDLQGHLGVKKSFLSLCFKEDADFYMFSDQDDIWLPSKISKLLNAIQGENQEIPILIHSDYQTVNKDGEKINGYLSGYQDTELEELLLKNNVTGCTCLFNRSLKNCVQAKKNEIDYSRMIMHDWWLAIIASAFGKVMYFPEVTVLYRQHSNNVVGAVTANNSFLQRLLKFLSMQSSNINKICVQADLFKSIYPNITMNEHYDYVDFFSKLLSNWKPINQVMYARKYVPRILSRFNSLQFYFFILMPVKVRQIFA